MYIYIYIFFFDILAFLGSCEGEVLVKRLSNSMRVLDFLRVSLWAGSYGPHARHPGMYDGRADSQTCLGWLRMIGGAVLISGNGSEVLTWLAESRTGTATISERTAGSPVRTVIGSLVRVQVKWRIFPESRDQKFGDRRTHIHLISTHRADSEERCFIDD